MKTRELDGEDDARICRRAALVEDGSRVSKRSQKARYQAAAISAASAESCQRRCDRTEDHDADATRGRLYDVDDALLVLGGDACPERQGEVLARGCSVTGSEPSS